MKPAWLSRFLTISYPITRPLPHARVLGTLMVVGALLLSVLFGFVAVATNAYTVKPYYTTDPNTTESNAQWFQRQPFSSFGSPETECQSSLIRPGDLYMTTNRGFTYMVDGLSSNTVKTQGSVPRLPQIMYRNATLENCEVSKMRIHFRRLVSQDNLGNGGRWWTWDNTGVQTLIVCAVADGTQERKSINFTLAFPEGHLEDVLNTFMNQDNTGHKSMYYGWHLSMQWSQILISAMGYQTPHIDGPPDTDSDIFSDGTVELTRNKDVTDWKSLGIFTVYARFGTLHGWIARTDPPNTLKDWQDAGPPGPDHGANLLPRIAISLDAFAKSLYSLIALDFGVADQTNPLLTASGVAWINETHDPEAEARYQDARRLQTPIGFTRPGYTQNMPWMAANEDLGTVPPARLSTQYLCSVPTAKSTTSIAYSVILAILVFIRAAWSFATIVAQWIWEPKDGSTNECVGCAAAAARSDYIPMHSKSADRSSITVNTAYSHGMAEHDDLLPHSKQPSEIV